jgi:hypothetical protein
MRRPGRRSIAPALRARVRLVIDVREMLKIEMRVDLRRR